jgi:hypothetical protein
MNKQFIHHARYDKIDSRINERSLWDKFWKSKEGRIVISQFPNIWLILWFILEVVSLLVSSHHAEIICWWLATAALSVWSLFEIFRGVNYFRRLLGFCIAILILLSVFGVGL